MNQKILRSITEMYQHGLNTIELSNKFNIPQPTIWWNLNKAGIKCRTGGFVKKHRPWNKNTQGLMPTAWNKNKEMPLEQRQRQSETRKKLFAESKLVSWSKGKQFTLEHRQKLSEIKKYQISIGTFSNKMTRGEIDNTGANHWNWKGGISDFRDKLRGTPAYKLWRTAVFKRDNYTCQFCGKRGGWLEADHILPLCENPNLCFDINNGRTLCKSCHDTTKHRRYNSVLTLEIMQNLLINKLIN